MEFLDCLLGVFYGRSGFPRIFRCGIPFPFDQVEYAMAIPRVLEINDLFDFKMLVFIVDDFWRRASEIGSMLFCFFIRGDQRVMEHWVNLP